MICVDTNVVIGFLRGAPRRLVERFERDVGGGAFALPAIALFELRYGVAKSLRPRENADRLAIFLQLPIEVLNFEAYDADEAGDIRAHLEREGTPIGAYDLLIAAQARRRDISLITANVAEFARVPGLRIEDWSV
jgi:tRNA(fMet)-specific endonuclease VapC